MKVLLLILVGIVVVGGGVYIATQGGFSTGPNSATSEEEHMAMEENEPISGEGTLRSLLALGKDLTCDFAYTSDEDARTEGTVYLSGERMRGNFTMMMDDQHMEAHTIRDGETAYVWGTTPYGEMATKFNIMEDEGDDSDSSEQSIDLDESVEYDCRGWSVDGSMFTPPSDVQFQDLSAQMQMMQDTNMQMQGTQCDACAQIPDPNARAQCETALGC